MVSIPFAHVVFRVRECSDNTKEFNGKEYYYVRLEDCNGYGFNKMIDHHVKVGAYLLYKVKTFKGEISLQYVKDFDVAE